MAIKPELIRKELDDTLSQRLDVEFTDAEEGRKSSSSKRISANKAADITNFAQFLRTELCLENLQFWKEVESYKSLSTAKERAAFASRLWDLYIVDESDRKVNVQMACMKDIEERMKEPKLEADLFNTAQFEVYEMMRMDLYPRYYDAMAAVGTDDVDEEEVEEEEATSLQQVLQGTSPAALHHFERFARENFLEESLLFWQDAAEYKLLFSKRDMQSKCKEIYEKYMGPTAKYSVNISDALVAEIKAAADAPLEEAKVDGSTLDRAQKEAENFLQLDVWARYEEWAKGDGKVGKKSAAAESTIEYDDKDVGKMREATKQLLTVKSEVDTFKQLAKQVDAAEAIEFYLDIKEYQMLFSAKDFQDRSKRLWNRYLGDKAERPVNLPASVLKVLKTDIIEKDCASVDVKTFDRANKEMLQIITDNVYPAWLKAYKAKQAGKDKPAAISEVNPAVIKSSGGCCVIL